MGFNTKKFTGSGALSASYNPERPFILENVRLTLDSAASTVENFTLILDSAAGSEYDVQLITQAMGDVKTLACGFDNENKFQKDDTLVFLYANSDNRTWGLEVRTMGMC